MTADDAYHGTFVMMWTVTLLGAGVTALYAHKLRAALREQRGRLMQAALDEPVAAWCRHTNLTVVTNTGTEFTSTLADIQRSEFPSRAWNGPMVISLWADPQDNPMNFDKDPTRA